MQSERFTPMELWATQSKFRAFVFLLALGLTISSGLIGGVAALAKIANSGAFTSAVAAPP